MFDLHAHSNFSDGLHAPRDLLERALAAGVTTLALTDHDTIAGVAELKAAAQDKPIKIIVGIELSTRWKKHDLHVLGLNVNPQSPELLALIERQNDSRIQRALTIGERLEELGIPDAYKRACVIAGHDRVTRPHYAAVLMADGLITETQQAFKRYLGRGRPAYVATPWAELEEVVQVINAAGGNAIVAHPLKYDLTRTKLHELAVLFKDYGGAGFEVVSGETNMLQAADMAGICERYGLYASSGSDFHGEGISRIGLGRQRQLPVHCKPIWQLWNN